MSLLKKLGITASLIGATAAASIFGSNAQQPQKPQPQQQTISQTQEQTYEPIINLREFKDIVPLRKNLIKDYPNYNINNVTLEDPGTHCFNFFVIPPTLDEIKLIYVGEDYETFLEDKDLDSIIDNLFNGGIRNYNEIEYDCIEVAKTTLPFLQTISERYPDSEVAGGALYLTGKICLEIRNTFSSSKSKEEMEQRIKDFKEYGIHPVKIIGGIEPNIFTSAYDYRAFKNLNNNYPTSEFTDDASYELVYESFSGEYLSLHEISRSTLDGFIQRYPTLNRGEQDNLKSEFASYIEQIVTFKLKEFIQKYPNSNKREDAKLDLELGFQADLELGFQIKVE